MKMQWMRWSLAALGLLVAVPSGVSAQCEQPCEQPEAAACEPWVPPCCRECVPNPCFEGQDWRITAEAIWWGGPQQDFNYAEVGFIDPNNGYQSEAIVEDLDSKLVKTKYSWGFRLGYDYRTNPWGLSVRYLWLEISRIAGVARGNPPDDVLSVPFFSGEGSNVTLFDRSDASLDVVYNHLDARLTYQVCLRNCVVAEIGWRLSSVYERDRFQVKARGEQLINDQGPFQISGRFSFETSRVGAMVGPILGFEADLTCGFYLTGQAGFECGVLYQRNAIDTINVVVPSGFEVGEQFLVDERFPISFQSRACLTTALKGHLVLNYRRCCGCMSFYGNFGWEMHGYDFARFGGPIAGFGIGY